MTREDVIHAVREYIFTNGGELIGMDLETASEEDRAELTEYLDTLQAITELAADAVSDATGYFEESEE